MSKKNEQYYHEFAVLFSKLSRVYDRWKLWSDFLEMFACDISAKAAPNYRKERSKRCLAVCEKYRLEDLKKMYRMFELLGKDLEVNRRDFCKKVIEEFHLVDKAKKQNQSPEGIGRISAKLVVEEQIRQIKEKGYASVMDSCCGTGSLLISIANEMCEREIYYPYFVEFVGQDISYPIAQACYIQLSLLKISGYVIIGDTLKKPVGTGDTLTKAWYTPMYFDKVWTERRMWHYVERSLRDK